MKKILFTAVACTAILMVGCDKNDNADNPKEGVAVATPTGRLIWAGSNLKTAGEFCDNPWDFGDYFTWEEAQTVCPTGWRLPTALEFDWMINLSVTEITNARGVESGDYTGNTAEGASQANTWVAGAGTSAGFFVYPNTGGAIQLPNAGMQDSDSSSTVAKYTGEQGFYWSSDVSEENACHLYFNKNITVGYLNPFANSSYGFSVRCVRDYVMPKYTLSIGIEPSSLSVTPTADPATVTTEGVIATQQVELVAPAAPTGYVWVGWQPSGAVELVSGTDWTAGTINVYVTGTGAAVTAEYREPLDGVVVGSVTWAATNLSGVGTFCDNPWDYGYYFTWEEAQTACPSPWRLPTALEFDRLINKSVGSNVISTGEGATSGDYTGNKSLGAIAVNKWVTGTGSSSGFFVYPNSGGVIQFPNAGIRTTSSGATANSDAGAYGFYWSSDADGLGAYYLFFHSGYRAGWLAIRAQTGGLSVRCVRD